jgi:hypothetical protein
MEYFTSKEQEEKIAERYRKRMEQEQDRIRNSLYRHRGGMRQDLQEEDRIFFVESDGNVYLGEIKPENLCPPCLMEGGSWYGVDTIFLREVNDFVRHHSQYVVIFHIKRGYSHQASIFPARMIADQDELMLEDFSE